ncbi:MAG: hypothetical protein SNJ82_14280, partial [Gemmataceae bacterium]
MRISMMGRYLLLGCTLCLIAAIYSERLIAADGCDTKCREINWGYEDSGKGIFCYHAKLPHCLLALGGRAITGGPGVGTCTKHAVEQVEVSQA